MNSASIDSIEKNSYVVTKNARFIDDNLSVARMQFKQALEILRNSKEFLAWQAENPDHYLAHGFYMDDKQVIGEWQIGFYNRKEDRIVVFTVGNEITRNPPSEVFKKESGVRELHMDEIEADSDTALDVAHMLQKEKYPGNDAAKTIILLQHLAVGQVWNISFITQTYAICNVKVDTKSLEVVSSSCESLMAWGEAVKGERKR